MSQETNADFNQTLLEWMGIFARRSIHDFMLFAHQNNLSMAQISILLTLHYRGPATIAALRKEMVGSRAAATQMIDGLVRSGWVVRAEDKNDRRLKVVSLTEEGRRLVERSINARRQWMTQLADSFTPQQRSEIYGVLRTMIQAARESDAEGADPMLDDPNMDDLTLDQEERPRA